MSHFGSGCPYPHDQCKCYTARSWSPGSEQPEDARCVNCNQSHGPAVGGSESRVAPGQPAGGERSAPPTDLDWMEAVPDSLVDDLHSELGLLLNVDGHNDEAAEWLGDIVSTVTCLAGRELAGRDNAIEDLRQDVGRLIRERNEWEANEREQYRKVLELRAELDRMQRMLGRAFPAWTGSERDRAETESGRTGSGSRDTGSSRETP